MRADLENIPNRQWNKNLEREWEYRGKSLKIYSVDRQAHLIGVTQAVGLLEGFSSEAILTKAFQKNYHSEAARPGVVSNYGFEQKHGEPIEMIDFVYETFFDRATEGEMNRYRHNSKNLESGRYVDYTKYGLTVVIPDDVREMDDTQIGYTEKFFNKVQRDLEEYVDVLLDSNLPVNKRKQQARRRIGEYRAVEGVYKTNLRSLVHMGTQRSAEFSPNGREAEPAISDVVTDMLNQAIPHLPVFSKDVREQLGKGYR